MRAPNGVRMQRRRGRATDDDDPQQDAGRNAGRPGVAEPDDQRVLGRDGAAAGDDDQQTLQERRHGQRHDHRMDAQQRDAEPVDEADAVGERQDARGWRSTPGRIRRPGDSSGRPMALTVTMAADRQVDAAGDDHEGLADRDEADDGGELDEVAQMADRRRSRAKRSWRTIQTATTIAR